MGQKVFGRRQAAAPLSGGLPVDASAAAPGRVEVEDLAAAEAPSRSAVRSAAILAGVGTLGVVMALGVAYGLGTAISPDNRDDVARYECRGRPDCANQYKVSLTCAGSEERSVGVVAASPDVAERWAERHNRDCRSHGAEFVAGTIRNAYESYGDRRYVGTSTRYAEQSSGPLRFLRFRRR